MIAPLARLHRHLRHASIAGAAATALVALLPAFAAGCVAPPPKVPLPSDGSNGPAANAVPGSTITPDDWRSYTNQKLAPICDARSTPAHGDAALIATIDKGIAAWTAVKKKEAPPDPKHTIKLGKSDASAHVASFAFSCAGVNGGTTSALTVNGVAHAFDLAWAVTTPDDIGNTYVSVLTWSAKDKMLVFGELEYDNLVDYGKIIITNIAAYVPPNEADPLVLTASGTKSEPKFRAYLTDKAATGGYVFYVPDSSDALMTAIYFADAGRFTIVAK